MTDGKQQTEVNVECDETKCSLWSESVLTSASTLLSSTVDSEEGASSANCKDNQNKENCKDSQEDCEQYPYVRESRSLSLSESYSHLYLFHLPQQLTSTIMSGLSNLINHLELSTILQNFVNNSIFKRRNSTPLVDSSSSSKASDDSNNPSTSYNSNTFQSKTLAKLFNDKTSRTLKTSELIELDNFGLVELDNSEAGIGHDFEPYKNDKPTWCDACADYLSTPVMNGDADKKGDKIEADNDADVVAAAPVAVQTDHLMRIYIQCRKCKYVCHLKCYPMIRIDCRPAILVDGIDPSTRLRTNKSKPKSNRHRNSVRFDGPIFPDAVPTLDQVPQVEAIEEIVDIDSNNNCNNEQQDADRHDHHHDISVSDPITDDLLDSSSTVQTEVDDITNGKDKNDDDDDDDGDETSTVYTSFDESSTTYDPDSSQSTSSSSYQNTSTITTTATNNSNETLSESVFQSDNDNVPSEHNSDSNDSNSKQSSTYSTTELLVPSLIVNLKDKVLKYNDRIRSKGSGLGITLIDEEKQLFRGFLKVHMNLTRPINVVAGKRPPSIYDIINEQEDNAQQNQQRRTLTSFYMPRDTVKNIHVTSENSTLHVIKEMLKKFKVVDNPQKFALYLRRRFPDEESLKNSSLQVDQNYEKAIGEFLNSSNTQNSLKRLHDMEKPLILQLEFGSFAPDCVDIVLQENDNADICWDAFEIPELKNFLKILDREESEHLSHVRAHYIDKKRLIQTMIEREEAKLSSVNISHPNSPERFNGNGPPGNNGNNNNSGSSNSTPVIAN